MPGEKRIFTTWLTGADRIDHAVTDEEFTANRPEPEALCGAVILLAPMEAPPGPHCVRCTTVLAARDSLRDLERRIRPHGTAASVGWARSFTVTSRTCPSPVARPSMEIRGDNSWSRQMCQAVCDMIALHTCIPRLEP
jgi:hypothetical protein